MSLTLSIQDSETSIDFVQGPPVPVKNGLIVFALHLWTQWHGLELTVDICRISIVSCTGEHPALSLLLIFQLWYLKLVSVKLIWHPWDFVYREQRVKYAHHFAIMPHTGILCMLITCTFAVELCCFLFTLCMHIPEYTASKPFIIHTNSVLTHRPMHRKYIQPRLQM